MGGARGVQARFVVGSAMALPFEESSFDGVLAALVLDNLSRVDCARAVAALSAVAQRGARGFFAFSPVLTEAELAAPTSRARAPLAPRRARPVW